MSDANPNVPHLFQPKGLKSQREMIYDLLVTKQVNDVITYDEVSAVVGFDVRLNRGPLYQAQRTLERNDHRTVDVVKTVGYRVVEAAEHEGLARNHQKRGRRQIRRALDKVIYVDRARLTPALVKKFDQMQMTLQRQEHMIRNHDIRMENIEQAITENRQATASTSQTAEQLAIRQQKMREALERAGIVIED